jgi:hypothetical protein
MASQMAQGTKWSTDTDGASLLSRLVASSEKASEKYVADETTRRIQNGEHPLDVTESLKQNLAGKMQEQVAALDQQKSKEQILAELTQIASTQVDDPKKYKGPLAIFDALQGKGFDPFAHRQTALGYDLASKVMSMEQGGKKDAYDALAAVTNAQKSLIDLQNSDMETESKKTALEQAKLNLQESQGKFYLATGQGDKYKEVTGVDMPANAIQRDINGNLTSEGIKQQTQAEGKISDVQKTLDAQQSFEGKLIAAVSGYEKLSAKGKTGPVSGIIGKVKSTLSSGDPDKAEFESSIQSLVWAGAAQIAGQSGRGVSDKDYERVAKMVNFGQMDKEKTVEGKVQFMMNELNTKVLGGGLKIKSAKSLINYVRAKNAGAVGKNVQGEYVDATGKVVKVKTVGGK